MKKLNKCFWVLAFVLMANIANAAVTLLTGNQEGTTEGSTPYTPVMMMASPAPLADVGMCSTSTHPVCASGYYKETMEACMQTYQAGVPIQCCDADDGSEDQWDCFIPCSSFTQKYSDVTLYDTMCTLIQNAETSVGACNVDGTNSWKYACKCSSLYSSYAIPSCSAPKVLDSDNDGVVDDPDKYACYAGGINDDGSYIKLYKPAVCRNPLCENNVGTELDFDAVVESLIYDDKMDFQSMQLSGNGCVNRFYDGHPYTSSATNQCRKLIEIASPDMSQYADVDICSCPSDYYDMSTWKTKFGRDYVPLVTIDRNDTLPKLTGGVCFWNALNSSMVTAQNDTSTITIDGSDTISTTSWKVHNNDYSALSSANGFFYNGSAGTPCEDWEKTLIKNQYDEKGYNFIYAGGCPSGAELRTCAYAFDLGIGLPSGSQLYEEVSFCACKRNNNNDTIYTACSSPNIGGGDSCSLENGTLYQYCLPQCEEKFVDLNYITTQCTNTDGKIITQSPIGEYKPGATQTERDLWIENNQNNLCFEGAGSSSIKWQCGCPEDWKTCVDGDGDGVGPACPFASDGVLRYEQCGTVCDNTKDTIVDTEELCTNGTPAGEATQCFMQENADLKYICDCTEDYQSIYEKCGAADATACDNDNTCKTCKAETLGWGEVCKYDNVETSDDGYNNKFSEFCTVCSAFDEDKVDDKYDCDYPNYVDTCCEDDDGDALGDTEKYICRCPDNYKTIAEYCNNNASCINNTQGNGIPCTYEGENKYGSFGTSCPTDGTQLYASAAQCVDSSGTRMNATPCTNQNGEQKYTCSCKSNYMTLDEYCRGKGSSCKNEYIPMQLPQCTLDTEVKYSDFRRKCPTGVDTVSTVAQCSPGVENYKCYDADGTQHIVCKCATSWKTLLGYCQSLGISNATTCEATYKPVGNACTIDGGEKYASFIRICPTGRDFQTSPSCGNGATGIPCDDNGTTKYICECPSTYQTFDEFCAGKGDGCKNEYTPYGEACTFEDSSDPKYGRFIKICPNDRPSKSTEDECTSGVDFECIDGGTEKFVCKCPSNWYDSSNCSGNKEPAGNSCDFESYANLKYELCLGKCDTITTNGSSIIYLNENNASEQQCKFTLGEGATYGFSQSEPRCSKDNAPMYPCYCGTNYSETCELSQNKLPPDNPQTCTVDGTVYYNQCKANDCKAEAPNVAIITDTNINADPSELCANAGFGSAVSGRRCGFSQIECICDTSVYNDICKYPLSAPDDPNAPWCKYGDGNTLMKNGKPHYKTKDCSTKDILGKCGEYILNADGSHNYSVTIHVTASDTLCKSKYGTGATPVLCDYADNPNRRAYNCWYNEKDYIWTEYNCPIRHVFGKNYVYKNGVKHHDTCDCHPNYKYHKFNCNKTLSGGACIQKLTTKQVNNDTTLQTAVANGRINVGQNIQLYGYCK